MANLGFMHTSAITFRMVETCFCGDLLALLGVTGLMRGIFSFQESNGDTFGLLKLRPSTSLASKEVSH